MTSRDQFEAWIADHVARENRVIRIVRERDWYAGRDKHFLNTSWAAWQASRESMVVELPETTQAGGPDDEIYWPADVYSAIEAAGLRVGK